MWLPVLFALSVSRCAGWHRWEYSAQWSDQSPEEALRAQEEWTKEWGGSSSSSGPRPRRGHSLVLFHSNNSYPYYGDSYIIMFGGRDNDDRATHEPKTYDLKKVNNKFTFDTYNSKPVNPCSDNGTYYSEAERAACNATVNDYSTIDVGVFYNDVWAYKLCKSRPPYRYFNAPCVDSGWVVWHKGAREGGCEYKLSTLVCTTPSERYNHGAAVFSDGAMLVYGGFSQRCADYCDDLWMFDVSLRVWRQVYNEGRLSRLHAEVAVDGSSSSYAEEEVPVDSGGFAGPGKRWRHSMVAGAPYVNAEGAAVQSMAVFGGHRLWHGFSWENSQDNDWSDFTTRPAGGYLNDLWIYTRDLDETSVRGETLLTYTGRWEQKQPVQECQPSPGVTWESRDDVSCSATWPEIRAGHSSAFDSARNLIWIFGGYSTYFPYLSTGGEGSGPGTTSARKEGFVPYPGYTYYRNDLWIYNMTTGKWSEVAVDASDVPLGRMDSVFLLLGEVLFLHGGYGNNVVMEDTWYFNISNHRWLRKKEFVTPIFPPKCSDDLAYIANTSNKCSHLKWPKHLTRDSLYPFNISSAELQPYHWPNADSVQEFDVLPIGSERNLTLSPVRPFNFTPLFPYSATGPLQFVRSFDYELNGTFYPSLLESCTSVFSEPTRGRGLSDGLFGRALSSLFIAQPRRQRAGWDGCRDRFDAKTDLPNELQYVRPHARFGHRAVYYAESNEILMYGGMAMFEEHAPSVQDSFPQRVSDDMWFYSLNHCQNNCSLHGNCYLGYCLCDVGFYGIDCSNTSCAGTFCHYDENILQICVHACQAGYNHTDDDVYIADIAKLPCSESLPGESNGICDGFGTAYCAPPFVGEDCSIKDCKNNCSFNGYCSIEYPVSRCMCLPGYYGEVCEKKFCLNNCSYPNGVCYPDTGVCACNMMYSPYNNTRAYHPWGGEDCSFLFAYAGAGRTAFASFALCIALVLIIFVGLIRGE